MHLYGPSWIGITRRELEVNTLLKFTAHDNACDLSTLFEWKYMMCLHELLEGNPHVKSCKIDSTKGVLYMSGRYSRTHLGLGAKASPK